jgi:hypothetical protein
MSGVRIHVTCQSPILLRETDDGGVDKVDHSLPRVAGHEIPCQPLHERQVPNQHDWFGE